VGGKTLTAAAVTMKKVKKTKKNQASKESSKQYARESFSFTRAHLLSSSSLRVDYILLGLPHLSFFVNAIGEGRFSF
jgi:O-antigen/teichoic acid export membrane protein